MIYETLTDIGERPYMEDVLQVVTDGVWNSICVADGHGGASVAKRTMQLLPPACVRDLSRFGVDLEDHLMVSKILWKTFNEIDRTILAESPSHEGATFCGLFYDKQTSKLIAANCGDTMAAVFYMSNGVLQSELISTEHKASSEVGALQARGATVVNVYGMMRVQGTLNLSRAMGDGYLKQYIICSPAVTMVRVDRLKQEVDAVCVVVASDGVWDVMDKNDIGRILESHGVLGRQEGKDATSSNLKSVADTVHRLCRLKGSTDNVAIVVAMI
jgi:serine/threonine protein phosphatase PrpC